MESASASATSSFIPWVRQKASNRFAWLEWVVKSNLPLSFVENPVTRRYTNLPPVSVDTLRLNMEAVTREVETIIGAEMPNEFGLMLDGWSNGIVNEPEDDRGANLMGVPLVGCASHRLNLALKAFLAPYEADLCEVQRLMKKLKTLSE
ncbi:hypothetical protein F443_04389 [Phytophthora nicotianae P1569]|nr:hypothetical protein F443_04389 [Phytophthora nicotianae P1569]